MDHCKDFIKAEFPSIDIEMFQYIEGKIAIVSLIIMNDSVGYLPRESNISTFKM